MCSSDLAIENYEKAIEYDEENSKYCYYRLGWLYNDLEEYDEAVDVLLKALDYNADDANSHVELGYAYYMKKENNSAEYQLQKAIELDTASKMGHYYLGLLYIDLDRKNEAREMYNKLKDIDEDQAEKLLKKIEGEK